MLIKFSVENFLSFMDKSSLNLEAGSIREFNKNTFPAKIGTQDIKLLKSVFLYGYNAAGKSNFLKAFIAMKSMVLQSAKDQRLGVSGTIVPFLLNRKTQDAPTTFETTFLIDRVCYRYGFTADVNKVHSEWLWVIHKRKEENIFIRTAGTIEIDKRFPPDQRQKLKFLIDMTRQDSLFLSLLSQFNIEFALKILKWFQENTTYTDSVLDSTGGDNAISYTASLLKKPLHRELIYWMLEKAELGFYSIEEEISDQLSKKLQDARIIDALNREGIGKFTIKTRHTVYNEKQEPVEPIYFDLLKEESAGSKKFISLLGPISEAIIEGKIMWIDELDAQLHILLVNLFMKLFHNSPFNIHGAQIIITTHNSHILKKLRRDQMIMLNKDPYGASTIGSVYTTKPGIRSDVVFDKEYLSGNLGGIPKSEQLSLFDSDED